MGITPSSLAAGVGAAVQNTNFKATGTDVPRRILVPGVVLPANEGNFTSMEYIPQIVASVQEKVVKAGQGSHAAAQLKWADEVFKGEVWFMPIFEDTATQSTGNILWGGTCTKASQLHLYEAGHKILNINIAVGDDGDAVCTKVVAAMATQPDLLTTSAVNGTTSEQTDFTAKSGVTGWDPKLTLNENLGEVLPEGITATITQMSGGVFVPSMSSILTALGSGDSSNSIHFTAIVNPCEQDGTSLAALSTYNGDGNTISGCYDKMVCRPMRSIVGDTVAGSSGLTALLAIGATYKETDRTTGIVAVPGSPNLPAEIAVKTLGMLEATAAIRPQEGYNGKVIPGIIPGALADDWCSDYDDRDTATKAGITPTKVEGGAVKLSNVVTLYHSDSIPVASNGYREISNIPIHQNVLDNVKSNFASEKWIGTSIVADKTKVTNVIDRLKARDSGDVIDDLISLLKSWESRSWIWSAAWSIAKLQEGGDYGVQIRALSNGFDITLPILLRVPGNIFDTTIQFDANVAIAL